MPFDEMGPDIDVTREKVAKFLYKNDGNPKLPQPRIWGWLAPYWKARYLVLADKLLTEITEEPHYTHDTVSRITY